MTVEDLQLVSSSVKLEDNSNDLDEISVDYTVHPGGDMARLVRWRCACPTDDGLLNVAEATYWVLFDTDAASAPLLESKMLEVTWPYFRQFALGSSFLNDQRSGIMLPIEILSDINKKILPKNGSEIADQSNDKLLLTKKFWEDKYTENTQISLKLMLVLLEIQEKKREWLFSLTRLLIYLRLLKFGEFSNIPVYLSEFGQDFMLNFFRKDFELSEEESLKLNDAARIHVSQTIENMILSSLQGVFFSNADPETSEISDEFSEDVDQILEKPFFDYIESEISTRKYDFSKSRKDAEKLIGNLLFMALPDIESEPKLDIFSLKIHNRPIRSSLTEYFTFYILKHEESFSFGIKYVLGSAKDSNFIFSASIGDSSNIIFERHSE